MKTLFYIAAALLLGGCSRLYLPAIWDTNPPELVPLSTAGSQPWVGASATFSSGYNRDEANTQVQAIYAYGDGGRWWRVAINGIAYGGRYRKSSDTDTFSTSLGYYGLGGTVDLNVALPVGPMAFGMGGWLGPAFEFGPYADVWEHEGTLPVIPLVGVYAYFSGRVLDEEQLEVQASLGFPGYLSFNGSYYFHPFAITIGTGLSPNTHSTSFVRASLGFAYRL